MTETAPHLIGVRTTGGFQIETRQDELIVTASLLTGRKRLVSYLACGIIFSCIFLFSASRYSLFFVIFLAIIIALQYAFTGIHNLRCDRDSLDVIDVFHFRPKRTRSFRRDEVKRVRFGAVSYSKYGAICGLVFTVASKDIKSLYGLKCVEAQRILREIQRLGYDVEHDVAMPMMVEMEQSRRKWWFNS